MQYFAFAVKDFRNSNSRPRTSSKPTWLRRLPSLAIEMGDIRHPMSLLPGLIDPGVSEFLMNERACELPQIEQRDKVSLHTHV